MTDNQPATRAMGEWNAGRARCLRSYAKKWDMIQRDIADDFRAGADALDLIGTQADEITRYRDHIEEQARHANNRIKDGDEMGARVWRIALEDIVRENEAALNQGSSK